MNHGGPLYGPETLSWHVFREWPYLLGGMRAVLMQLAHPLVAAGVAEHSDFGTDPFSRLHRTMEAIWEIGVGTPEEARAALARLDAVHARVRGVSPDGEIYAAGRPDLKLWVHATLIDTVLAVDERYLRRFNEEERHRYYRESLALAEVFRIPAGLVPPELASFRVYVEEQVAGLRISEQARRMARHVLHPRVPGMPDLAFAPFRLVTADLLPERLRAEFGLPWTPHHRRAASMARLAGRNVFRRLPEPIRTLPVLGAAALVYRRLAA